MHGGHAGAHLGDELGVDLGHRGGHDFLGLRRGRHRSSCLPGSGADLRPALPAATAGSFQVAAALSSPEVQEAPGPKRLVSHNPSGNRSRDAGVPPEAELVGPEVRASVKPELESLQAFTWRFIAP